MELEQFSAFKLVGIDLIEKRKISAIPIDPVDKIPAIFTKNGWQHLNKWQGFAERLPIPNEYEYWAEMPEANVGICLGGLSGIIALDFDYWDDITDKIQKLIPLSPVRKKGQKGFTAFYKFNGEKNLVWKYQGKTAIELLSTGRQTVIPPSTHPAGINYTWLTENTLLDDIELPILPDNFEQIVAKVLSDLSIETVEKKLSPDKIKEPITLERTASLAEITEALKFIPSDDYHTWVKIGMSLHNWDSQTGFYLWKDWSSTSSKFDEKQLPRKWASFHSSSGGYSISSVFYEAFQHGFNILNLKQFELEPVFLNNLTAKKEDKKIIDIGEIKKQKAKKINPLPIDITLNAPGLVGKIVKYILQCSLNPQPELALAASLALVGTLKAHRVKSNTNLRTNNYLIGIAPASAGKDHAITCLQNILLKANLLKEVWGGKPASDSGLLSMLSTKPRKLVVWDEIGLALKEIADPKGQGHKKSIIALMMELFSSAGRTFVGKEYSNRDGSSPRVDILEPCLSVYGVTTPNHFYQSLNVEMLADGFISRFLVFEISNNFPDEQEIEDKLYEVPQDIIDDILAIEKMKVQKGILDITGSAQKIEFTAEALEYLKEVKKEFLLKKREAFNIIDGLQSLYGRAGEHIIKLALTVQEGTKISLNDIHWATSLVKHCVESLASSLQFKLTESQFGAKMNQVKELLLKYPDGITKAELKRKMAYKIGKAKECEELIKTLAEFDEIQYTNDKFYLN